MADQAEHQANFGTPDQLPKGEAQQLSEAVSAIPDQQQPDLADQAAAAVPDTLPPDENATAVDDTSPATPADHEPIYTPGSDDEDWLTGPTSRPDEAQFVGASQQRIMPANVRSALPFLQRAASDPNASPELQALVATLLREA